MTPLHRTLRARVALLAATATFTGCASVPSPIHIMGQHAAVTTLVGHWSGEYSSSESGRHGVITFDLQAGDTAAYGDVLMLPRGFENRDVWVNGVRHTTVATRQPAVLRILFVAVAGGGGRVSGMLDPYTDPDCDCLVVTTFAGEFITSNTLEGRFVTSVPGTPTRRTGEWKVKRVANQRRE